MDKVNKPPQKLDLIARSKSAAWALLCMISAVFLLLYGLIFTTNIMSQLNPVNTAINVMIAMACYALIASGFYLLWRKFSQLLNQVFSGFKQ
jgi:hypothetical protein